MQTDLAKALAENKHHFRVELTGDNVLQLEKYYGAVTEGNRLLHLVAPCTPEEFAVRHILESLTLLKHLPRDAKLADIGAGAGLPSIPCLIARPDLRGILIESKEKKAAFLVRLLATLAIGDRVQIVNRQFEEAGSVDADRVTCRALDKFVEKLPRVLKWVGKRQFMFFGGPSLGDALGKISARFESELMPLSEQRYLFIGRRIQPFTKRKNAR